jgi:hypothetical protein
MPSTANVEIDDLDDAWHARSEIWERRYAKNSKPSSKRAPNLSPLILAGHGVSLRIDGGALTIRNGFTHYPQKQEIHRYFKGELGIPSRIIMLDGSGSISFDVLSWLAEQGVSLVRIDWRGEVVCVSSRSGYAANPFRVQWQRDTRADQIRQLEFSIAKITAKIENSILTLEKAISRSGAWEKAIERAYSTLTLLDEGRPKTISQ